MIEQTVVSIATGAVSGLLATYSKQGADWISKRYQSHKEIVKLKALENGTNYLNELGL